MVRAQRLALFTLLFASCPPARAWQPATPPAVPLAYVRRLALIPPALTTEPDIRLPPAPPIPAVRKYRKWLERAAERQQFAALRKTAVESVSAAIPAALSRLQGLSLLPVSEGRLPAAARAPVDAGAWAAVARDAGADAALLALVDRFGADSRTERSVWLHLAVYVAPADGGPLRGPVHGVGEARTTSLVLLKRFLKTDSQLVEQAVGAAVRQVAHALDTGEEWPFAHASRVAIVPAEMPPRAEKTVEGSDVGRPVAMGSVVRQADVLFQPELGPLAEMVDPDVTVEAVHSLHAGEAGLWLGNGKPEAAVVRALGNRLNCDYVFITRVTDLGLGEQSVPAQDAGAARAGLERRAEAEAEGCLVRVADGQLLWTDRASGSTVARTEFVRRQPRLRRDDQCLLDALRIAYAGLRFSLDNYKRRFEK